MDQQIIEPTNKSHRIIFTVITILLTTAVVGGTLWYVMDKQNKEQQKQIEELNKKGEESKKSEVKTEAKKEEVKTEEKKENTIPIGYKEYKNKELELSFVYKSEWGEVVLKSEEPPKGKGYRISFSNKKGPNATIRSKDFSLAPYGRGGAYWDSATTFSNNWSGEKKFSSTSGDGQFLIQKNDNELTYGYCSDFLASAGIDSYIRLGGNNYDVIKAYYLVREPRADGSGADLSGCENLENLVAPIKKDFLEFANSIKKY